MNKPELTRCNKLIDCGYSLIGVGSDKIPFHSWKNSQKQPLSKELFKKIYEDKKCEGVGIVTGYNDVYCIDVDLKVLESLELQTLWWNEFVTLLQDNISDFNDKFTIYKTVNNGYHIIFKNKTTNLRNKKIAKLKDCQEAII